MKKDIQDYYKKIGVGLVFPAAKPNSSLDDVIKNIFRLVDESFADRKNTKKPQEEEPTQKAADLMLKKSFDAFYRQLARTWHPDLEQNHRQRVLKEALIKKLTIAYKNNDLSELLILEIESKNPDKNFRAPADILLVHEFFEIALAYGHGLAVVSKVKIKFGPLKKQSRTYKASVKAIQVSK